jgi:hypothetical protein
VVIEVRDEDWRLLGWWKWWLKVVRVVMEVLKVSYGCWRGEEKKKDIL